MTRQERLPIEHPILPVPRSLFIAAFCFLLALLCCGLTPAYAADNWTVTIRVHEATSLSDDDADGPDDMYWDVTLAPTVGNGATAHCDAEEDHEDDKNHITPNWACTANVTGGANTNMQIQLVLMEHDTTSGNDEFDINPAPGQLGILMNFRPADSQLSIVGVAGRDAFQCAPGRIKLKGHDGDDFAEVVFSVSASLVGAPDGDSDNDGLADTWEQCGIDGDGDGEVDVKLDAMGANRFRKDIFVEIDWMLQPAAGATAGHSHEPWLPSLINAWNEFNVAPVTNPTVNGVATPGGIALHVDTGLLYRPSYGIDSNGDTGLAANEPQADANGNVDLNGDSIPDIGNLGQIGNPLGAIGGQQITEVTTLAPNTFPLPPAQLTDSHAFFDTGSTFANIKAANFNAARRWAFHYSIFGHLYADTLLQGVPANSSGLADNCGRSSCSDFMVTLGGFVPPGFLRQTVDTTGDGVPDFGGAVINGPSGLVVDGTFNDHTGTFLHELGHNLGLGHGGGDNINWKPNYLSIMNYTWQTRGVGFDNIFADNIIDQLGFSFDGDAVNDVQRFTLSGGSANPALGSLNEGVVTVPLTGFLDETTAMDTNAANNGMTLYTCPALTPPIPPAPPLPPGIANPPILLLRSSQPLNYDCDGIPNEPNVQADINNINLSSGIFQILNGFDDYNVLRNGGLRFNVLLPGIGAQEQIDLNSTTTRIVEDPRGREFTDVCERPKLITFEEFAAGTAISNQYAPVVKFLSDQNRTPMIAAGADRNNVPTRSPGNSLLNQPRSGVGETLVLYFSPPQRAVSFFYGQAGLTNSPREGTRVAVRAYDQRNLPMGEIRKPIPPAGTGINELLRIVTIWPDELMTRLEVRYEMGSATNSKPILEPVQIDDLMVCPALRKTGIPLSAPKAPVFGSLNVKLEIQSIAMMETAAADGDPDHIKYVPQAFTGLMVDVDGTASSTNFVVTRPEGTKLTISAPLMHGGRRFLHWKHSTGASFGKGNNTIPFTMLADGVLTAVYEGRERPNEHEHDPNGD